MITMSETEGIDMNRIACRFNGVPVKVRDQIILEVLLNECVVENGEIKRMRALTSTEICNRAGIDHRTQLHRSRKRLEQAGLIKTQQDPDDAASPLNPPTRIRPTPAAIEHSELLTRSPPALSLEERVERLEEQVDDHDEDLQEIKEEIALVRRLLEQEPWVTPDEFVFDK